jgi:hypothetical protein
MNIHITIYLRPYLRKYMLWKAGLCKCTDNVVHLSTPSLINLYISSKLVNKREFLNYEDIPNLRSGRAKLIIDMDKKLVAGHRYKSFLPDASTQLIEQFLRQSFLEDLYMAVAMWRDGIQDKTKAYTKEAILRQYLRVMDIDDDDIDYGDLRRALNRYTRSKSIGGRVYLKDEHVVPDVKKDIHLMLFK